MIMINLKEKYCRCSPWRERENDRGSKTQKRENKNTNKIKKSQDNFNQILNSSCLQRFEDLRQF